VAAWFKSLRARVTLFSMDGGVVPAVNDGRTRPSRQSGPTLYTAKCYPGLNQAEVASVDPTEALIAPALQI
jgi:hypothetical protein